MSLIHIIILAIVQGLAELLPVSSSAHVVVAEKLMGLDPTAPDMTLLLVMLHTGTMFAVILYFWKQWARGIFCQHGEIQACGVSADCGNVAYGCCGLAGQEVIKKTIFRGVAHAEIENLFGRLDFIAPALAAVGVLILIAGIGDEGWGGWAICER